MADMAHMFKTVGKAIAAAGVWTGGKIAEGYNAIDPDVRRHIAQVPLLSYSLFVSRKEKIDPGVDDGHPPLIFVHGLGGNRGNFLLMAGYFRFMGRRRSYKIHFDPGQSMDDMATALASFVRQVKKATGQSQVEIVAHSLGGVVARLAVNELRIAPSVKTLITLGSPHHGTYAARYANTDTTRNLRPDSDMIARLNTKPLPKHIRGISFFSSNDVFILPADSAVAEGTEAIDMTPFTHYSYLFSPTSWQRVWAALV